MDYFLQPQGIKFLLVIIISLINIIEILLKQSFHYNMML